MGTALLALCFCALSIILALFVGISPISDKAKIRFMYVGAALSLMAVPMMSHYIAGLNDIVDELRYQAVLVFIVAVQLFARPAHIGCLSHAALKYVLKVNRDVHAESRVFHFSRCKVTWNFHTVLTFSENLMK